MSHKELFKPDDETADRVLRPKEPRGFNLEKWEKEHRERREKLARFGPKFIMNADCHEGRDKK